jgi:hypothetical protein
MNKTMNTNNRASIANALIVLGLEIMASILFPIRFASEGRPVISDELNGDFILTPPNYLLSIFNESDAFHVFSPPLIQT